MLDVLNRYIHGYVAIPVILSCYKKGLFNILTSDGPLSLEQIADRLSGNEGHLQIALHMFQSMGWIEKNEHGYYDILITADRYQTLKNIPDKLLALYSIPAINLFKKYSYKKTLQKALDFVVQYENHSTPFMTDFVHGVVIIPLLIALKKNHLPHEPILFSTLPKTLREKVITFFVSKNWILNKENHFVLTDAGQFMLERAYNTATAASYAPMLSNMATLLFGDAKKVFKKNSQGHELHVDRTLNVIASGFQHVRYFEDVKEVIISIFNKLPFEDQPLYVIDTGCGDGTLLKMIYEIISEKSARGKVVEQYPLFMIGVDFNIKSLEETKKTLHNIPHFTLQGDIGNPSQIKEDLKSLDIPDPENCLHIRSFLDHDRPYIAPKNRNKIQERMLLDYSGVYVNSEGAVIQASEMVQSLVEHLSRWSKIISRHGMLILEVHCLPPETVLAYMDENESFHFDAYHAFSKQYLVEADNFLMSAAEVSLFPRMEFSRRYPSAFPYSRISLNYFEKRDYSIEYARKSDIPELIKLEEDCWPKKLCTSSYEINRRIEQFPQGQLVVKMDSRIVGVVYTQKIIDVEELKTIAFNNISRLHHANGKLIQLLGIHVLTEMQDTGLGNQLREFVLWWATLKGGIEKVVGVTRCKNYIENTHITMDQYIKQHIETEGGIDPILRFHTSHGATIQSILAEYRVEDTDNNGAGILIEYDLFNLTQASTQTQAKVEKGLDTRKQPNKDILDSLNSIIKKLISETHREQYSVSYPLREMGLDSLGLLELRTLINQQFKIKLDPTFFFEHSTPAAIADYLSQHSVVSNKTVEAEVVPTCHKIETDSVDDESIAIIGLGCRFPGGVRNADDFWGLLKEGKNAVTATPESRKTTLGDSISYGGFINDIDCFDADFFHISPREAELMDPQQRVLLEVTWEAIEQAGLCADKLNKTKTGVFVGIFSHDYETLLTKNKKYNELDAYYATGNSMSVAAGRLSYVLGLQGPAMAVNTACSSSLVAVHLACQSLRNGECEIAIAGGVNLILSPELNVAFTNAGMLSPEGKCKTFDASADGYVRGEGCGVLIFKKLSHALADNDNVLAVIRGSALNQDGKSNGLTAPSQLAQAELLRDTLKAANLSASSISYLETHGTGTSLGDPIEVKAINEVFGGVKDKDYSLILGSVKTNIGHTEAAAGMAGLIKTVLMLNNKKIPANLHFKTLNPHITLENDFLIFPTQLLDWSANQLLRRAGVSSFGFSGTNAHIIVEEAPVLPVLNQQKYKPYYLFTLSAKTELALKQKLIALHAELTAGRDSVLHKNDYLAAISYTLNHGRCHFGYRCALVASSLDELCRMLSQIIEKDNFSQASVHTADVESANQEAADKLTHGLLSIKHSLVDEYREALSKLSEYYCDGCDINWNTLHQGESQKRISLPVYPFAKDRYWYNSYQTVQPVHKVNLPSNFQRSNDVALEVTAEGIAIVRMLDRTGKNQLSFSLLHNLEAVFVDIQNNPAIKVVVLTGYDDVFCLGGSKEVLLAISKSEVKYTDMSFLFRGLLDCPVPVIGAIQGHAFGAGLAFGLYADIVVMSENSLYTANFMKYGFTPGVGSTLILQEKLSSPLATEMMWTAKEYSGLELKLRGANVSFKPSGEVFVEAMMLASALSKKSSQALRVFKKNMSEMLLERLAGTIERELQMHSDIFANPESTESIKKYFTQLATYSDNPLVNQDAAVVTVADKVMLSKTTEPLIQADTTFSKIKLSAITNVNEPTYHAALKVNEVIKQQINVKEVTPSESMNELMKIVSSKLHIPIEKIDINRSFRELGVDSISAVEIVRDVNQYFHLSVEAAMIYDHPTIKQFSHYLNQEVNKNQKTVTTAPAQQENKVFLARMPSSSSEKIISVDNLDATHKVSLEMNTALTDIAIIGFSGRFPGADNVDEFWNNLSLGKSAITEIPKNRWSLENFYDVNPDAPNRSQSKWGGFLNDIDQFDPLFFGISPAEAEQMDPQQRLFLQESWKVFEQAGYSLESLSGMKCAVYVGASVGDYVNKIKQSGVDSGAHLLIGSNSSILAARISYHLDLKGPSVAIDTACSSSLVAIHQACQSIWTGESDMALAGGVCILTTSEMHIMTSKAGMLSHDGQCKTFDNSADGFVPGEGVGVILLKPLHKAILDKDIIHGVIKGSGINQDGKTNGITAPCSKSQTELELDVYKRFNINPQTISYVEAHGTGTKLGDPIEVGALTKAFRAYTEANQYCAIGSVKTNIGHALLAAGVASLIKVLLCLKYKKLTPALNFVNQNEHINFENSPFYVNKELNEWAVESGVVRRAAISSFGLSGTNAHMILEEAPVVTYSDATVNKPSYLVTLSAKTQQALNLKITQLMSALKSSKATLENLSYTLNARKSHFTWRCAMVVGSLAELGSTLSQIQEGRNAQHYFINVEKNKLNPELNLEKTLVEIQNEIKQADLSAVASYKDKLILLMHLYSKGYDLDWEKLHHGETQRVVSLPTYPFSTNRYWVSETNTLLDRVSAEILKIASVLLKINVADLDVQQKMSEYGMDSIGMSAFISAVNHRYHLKISPAIMYEHATFESFINYLITNYRAAFDSDLPPTPTSPPPTKKVKNERSEDIAIIGMSGIFPEASSKEQFWNNLINGKDGVGEIPKERWDWQQYFGDPFGEAGKTKVKFGGFIKDIAHFDAAFFNISPREAELMDPQQRIFLQVVWQALEDSGYAVSTFSHIKTGVFVGVVSSDYAELLQKNDITDASIMTGNTRTMIANRISYVLNLQGPSEAIDTACSSSLVAIHHAVAAIRQGDCDVAIAGGVNALLTPTSYLAASKAGMLSEEGQCKTFDKDANGYVRAEGMGAIILKSLSHAKRDNDYIYGVIKGSAVNHGGHVSSLTVPNPNAQAEVISSACRQAGIPIESITYIETHGTGTALGDPIEINGLKKAFTQLAHEQNNQTLTNQYCGLGSVKTNIGHLESASGIASVIKVLLALKHQVIPANLHFKELNPFIEMNDTPFYLVNKKQAWTQLNDIHGNTIPRRAGVSAFGFGGVNAHLLIEEFVNTKAPVSSVKPYHVVTLSAKQEASLNQKIIQLHDWLNKNSLTTELDSLAYTLNLGRDHFNYRCAIVVSSLSELVMSLSSLINNEQNDNCLLSSKVTSISIAEMKPLYQSAINGINLSAHTYKNDLFMLADLYVKNYPVDFSALYQKHSSKRIASLPTYPFLAQHFWFDTKKPVFVSGVPSQPLSQDLHNMTLAYLQNIFADKLKLSPQQINTDTTYEVYGVESLLGLEITKRLEDDFGNLPKTLLYEKNKLIDLAKFFEKKHLVSLQKLFSSAHEIKSTLPASRQSVVPAITAKLSQGFSEDIAIVGLSGVYPMAKNVDEFWSNLQGGVDCISEVPVERWNYKDYPVMINGEEKYFKHGGFINDVDKFDPLFFNISPKDAALLDPQERLFMQSAWATIEDAGYTRESLQQKVNNRVGVFVGVTYNFYPLYIAEEWHKGNRLPLDVQLFSIANRVSYFLNLTGPSFIVDTACSSSMAAIHLAYESIVRGECSMAIAGGVNLSLHPSKFHMLGSYNFMSEQGRCTSFGANGTGYVPGEGVGSVLLKPLSMALKDNDHIYGVIKSSSMNHGGKTSGYTVPNPNAQSELIKLALEKAQIDPRTISYIEAHGTGTALGDPIEIRGLQDAFEDYTQDKQFCAIGSVKSSIGHLESAAGISQLTKVLLQLKHKKLVPSLHSKELNPFIDFDETPFYVQQEFCDWKSVNDQPLRAGISSFGAGGTNIHLIIEEYIADTKVIRSSSENKFIFVLSAQNIDRLREYAQIFQHYLQIEQTSKLSLNDICYTSQLGREAMQSRLALVVDSHQDLIAKIKLFLDASYQESDEIFQGEAIPLYQSEEDLSDLILQKNYSRIATAWTNGANVSWEPLYVDQSPQRISLPTYPFAKRRCWVPSQSIATSIVPIPALEPEKIALDYNEWLYSTRWEQKKTAESEIASTLSGHWLIFSDNELGLHLQDKLGRDNCTYCFAGDKFEIINQNVFYIDPDNASDYVQLFSHLHANNKDFAGIIYLAAFLDETQNTSDKNLWEIGLQSESSHTMFNLFHSLAQQKWHQELKFCLVTRNSQAIMDDDRVNIWQHHLWSMTRIFSAERPEYKSLLIDVGAEKHLNSEANLIVNELQHASIAENHVSYRLNNRYVLRLQNHVVMEKQKTWYAPEAVIITGGLGALGIEVAKSLVEQGTKYLLLIGTSVLPDQSNYASITDHSLKEKLTYLKELAESGVHVKYAAIDVSDKINMQKVINEAEQEWTKTITGVFHLAGVTTDNLPILTMSPEVLQKVLSVKIQGALVLHDIFNKPDVTCFVLFSSISALPYFGIGGLSAYAMANEFLNGLALLRRSQSLPAISINWAAWADKGMSFQYNHTAYLDAVGMTSVAISDGIKILKFLLTQDSAVVGVFKINWQKFLRINPDAKSLTFFDNYVEKGVKSESLQKIPCSNPEEITQLLITLLADLLELDISEIEVHIPLQNYGMDSIIGLQFVGSLGEHFPDCVSPMDLYRYPTLAQLTVYIAQTYKPAIAAQHAVAVKTTTTQHIDADAVNDPIAIIGIGCRFPEANNKNEYWTLLSEGKNIISSIPDKRWELLQGTEESLMQAQADMCKGGFLSDITGFDAYFFGITPREALRMDPQQRLLLEVAYEAIEDAGVPIESLAGSATGVFTSLYANQLSSLQKLDFDMDALYIPTGNAISMAANRLSYLFDLHGPSIALDTACSSSLVAIHLACLNLQNKLCDTALVCAANINLFPSINLLLSKAKMLSPDGQCKTFAADANGYVQGEGVGVIVLKPLSKALKDNDRIYGVIAGSAVNQDGKTNGLTAPNGLQQEALLKAAYEAANIDPKDVSYMECHGTGTFLGDPIEVQALGEVIGKDRHHTKPCWIGSVKTNIGHLEPAAGVASLIKVVLAMQHAQIPPHLNFSTPNPHIAFAKYNLTVPKKLEEWPTYGASRVAGISGFGFGGTNAHVIIRDLIAKEKLQSHSLYQLDKEELFTLSAKDPIALKLLVEKWCLYLQDNKNVNLSQLCYNVHVKRSHYALRIAIIANNCQDLYNQLNQLNLSDFNSVISTDKIFINIKKEKIEFVVTPKNELITLAQSYINRLPMDWLEYEESRSYPFMDIPVYPWQHKNYWPELKSAQQEKASYPFSSRTIQSPLNVKQFEFCFDTNVMPEIKDSFNFLHAGYYLEMLAIATEQHFKKRIFTIEDCSFLSPIFVPNNTLVKVQLILSEITSSSFSFEFYSSTQGEDWTQHATGQLTLNMIEIEKTNVIQNVLSRCDSMGTADEFFAKITRMNMPAGDSIRWTKNYYFNENEIVCELTAPKSAERAHYFNLNMHPGIIDGSIQSLFMLLPPEHTKPYIASSIKKLSYYDRHDSPVYLHAVLNHFQEQGEQYSGSFQLINKHNEVVIDCESLHMTQLSRNSQIGVLNQEKIDFRLLSTEQSQQKITVYLKDQVSKIFDMPLNDIDMHHSLSEIGIDSLMAIVLASSIESGLGVAYPMQSLLKGPSLLDIVSYILNKVSANTTEISSNLWLSPRVKQKKPTSRLFCFPYGGSGASIYHTWQKLAPDSIEICPIQLPGREDRMNEPSIHNMDILIDELIHNLQSDLDLPFSFFGHSFGSLVAFELTRALRKRDMAQPEHLFVSAFPDPCVPTKSLDNVISQLKNIHVNLFDLIDASAVALLSNETLFKLSHIFSDNGLIEYGANIMTPQIIKMLLPIFCSDMTLVKNYKYTNDSVLDLPINVFVGKQDTWVDYDDHLGWSDHTSKKCEIISFNSGHLFIREDYIKKQIINKIASVVGVYASPNREAVTNGI
jgi:acyl transferase domain-containing protein/surfactin synthase thioesterase subunit/enoyl-CoA hydratase/carnithine racemase